MMGPVLTLEHVSRKFGELLAVHDATITLSPGEIHAIVGENGAGKSTLLKLAAGALSPSEGRVLIDKNPLVPASAAEASKRGVGMVHQHFMLVSAFSAIENLVIGHEPCTKFGRIDWKAAENKARDIMKKAGLNVPLFETSEKLSVGERQRLEILRVLYRGARAILLDEPTAVLSPLEADDLYAMLRRLADDGNTVVVVTHRLDEVTRFAERVTVMRKGRIVLDVDRKAKSDKKSADAADSKKPLSEHELTKAIMGGEPPPPFSPPSLFDKSPIVLEIKKLCLNDPSGRPLLSDVELSIKSGEIVGIAGVEGNGQRELLRSIAGLEDLATGRILVLGKALSENLEHPDGLTTEQRMRKRRPHFGIVHEDRQEDGLLLEATVGENLILGDLGDAAEEGRKKFDEIGTINKRMHEFKLWPPDAKYLASELSGGNQQKIVLARALDRMSAKNEKSAVILAQPTRGVDVGAASIIHEAIGRAASKGLALLIISADLRELRTLCHRLLVLRKGRIVADFPPQVSDEELGRAMLGEELEA